jgi:hypothetical protein
MTITSAGLAAQSGLELTAAWRAGMIAPGDRGYDGMLQS